MDFLAWYLIIINIFTFILFTADLHRHNNTGETIKPSWIFIVSVIIGGSLGANLYFFIFFNRFRKPKGMYPHDPEFSYHRDYYYFWRILCIVCLVIHIVLCIIWYGPNKEIVHASVSSAIGSFFSQTVVLWIYLIIINIITFIVFLHDKKNAGEKKWRVREIVLFILAFVGGAVGGIIAMYLFHHKTKKQSFVVGLPLILFMHIIIIIVLFIKLV